MAPLLERHRKTLAALRAIGPCANAELARALRMTAADCYTLVSCLRRRGLVIYRGEESYEVTAEGRRELLVGKATVYSDNTAGLFDTADA